MITLIMTILLFPNEVQALERTGLRSHKHLDRLRRKVGDEQVDQIDQAELLSRLG